MLTAYAPLAFALHLSLISTGAGAVHYALLPMLRPILNASRYLVIIAVLGSLAAAAALFVYGIAETIAVIAEAVAKMEVSSKGAKALALAFIEIVDLFLLGTVLLMIALGLYELFIDSELKLPDWLHIRTFDDLKNKLVGVVLVVLAVIFLGHVVAWDGSRDLLGFGLAVAAVIAALTWFLISAKGGKSDKTGAADKVLPAAPADKHAAAPAARDAKP